MAITGIFFGSDTGNTENIAKMIQKQLGKDVADVHDIAKSSKEDLEGYDILLLGIPTWYYGEAQCDWDDFFPTLEDIDFNGKLVALFGCGDGRLRRIFLRCVGYNSRHHRTARRNHRWSLANGGLSL